MTNHHHLSTAQQLRHLGHLVVERLVFIRPAQAVSMLHSLQHRQSAPTAIQHGYQTGSAQSPAGAGCNGPVRSPGAPGPTGPLVAVSSDTWPREAVRVRSTHPGWSRPSASSSRGRTAGSGAGHRRSGRTQTARMSRSGGLGRRRRRERGKAYGDQAEVGGAVGGSGSFHGV